ADLPQMVLAAQAIGRFAPAHNHRCQHADEENGNKEEAGQLHHRPHSQSPPSCDNVHLCRRTLQPRHAGHELQIVSIATGLSRVRRPLDWKCHLLPGSPWDTTPLRAEALTIPPSHHPSSRLAHHPSYGVLPVSVLSFRALASGILTLAGI